MRNVSGRHKPTTFAKRVSAILNATEASVDPGQLSPNVNDELLRIACWNMVFGYVPNPAALQRQIDELVLQGARLPENETARGMKLRANNVRL